MKALAQSKPSLLLVSGSEEVFPTWDCQVKKTTADWIQDGHLSGRPCLLPLTCMVWFKQMN